MERTITIFTIKAEDGRYLSKNISEKNFAWFLPGEILKGVSYEKLMEFVYFSRKECEENLTWYFYLNEKQGKEPLKCEIIESSITIVL